MVLSESDISRFWRFVNKTDSCWIWIGWKQKGYGLLWVSGNCRKAHRISWIIANGPIPDGKCVLHNCPGGDNRSCVNPDHLWIGTQKDNNRDMLKKGGYCEYRKTSKLRASQVLAIRHHFYIEEDLTQYELAAKFNVSRSSIQAIVQGRNWKHLLPNNT